jgi:hypothetical protein
LARVPQKEDGSFEACDALTNAVYNAVTAYQQLLPDKAEIWTTLANMMVVLLDGSAMGIGIRPWKCKVSKCMEHSLTPNFAQIR